MFSSYARDIRTRLASPLTLTIWLASSTSAAGLPSRIPSSRSTRRRKSRQAIAPLVVTERGVPSPTETSPNCPSQSISSAEADSPVTSQRAMTRVPMRMLLNLRSRSVRGVRYCSTVAKAPLAASTALAPSARPRATLSGSTSLRATSISPTGHKSGSNPVSMSASSYAKTVASEIRWVSPEFAKNWPG